MNPQRHPSAYGYQPNNHSGYPPPYQRPPEDTLREAAIEVERKVFLFMLKENPRGRFLRITERSGHKQNAIIVPAVGLKELQKVLAEMLQADAETPPTLSRPDSPA